MILNILFPGNDKNKLNISSVRIMQIKNGKYTKIVQNYYKKTYIGFYII